MREIKFRAWTGKMLSPESTETQISLRGWKQSDEFILMQYTGLKDKNGKEIYEGDILGGIWEGCYIAWCDKCKSFEVFFDTAVFPKYCYACNGDAHWSDVVEDNGKLEVIGNIYETPELLEDK